MRPILQVFYSVFSGLLLALAIPNEFYLFGCPIFTLIAFIPFYFAISESKSYKWSFVSGFTLTTATHIASSFWLAYFKDFAALTLGASAIGTGFIGGFFGLFLYLPFSPSSYKNKLNYNSLHKNINQTPSFRIIYFAALYTLYEWVKSAGFLGYPWGTVSASMFTWPVLMQLSAITGTYGITFIIILINGFLSELIILYNNGGFATTKYLKQVKSNEKERIYNLKIVGNTIGIFLIVILTYGIIQYYRPRKVEKILTTVMVQQNLDPWSDSSDRTAITISQKLTEKELNKLKENNKEADLVVWSEGCLKRAFPYSEDFYRYFPEENPLSYFINSCDVPFLLGGSYYEEDNDGNEKYYNAALMYDETGRFRSYYGKNHLVPFAESLPFIEYPAVRNIMEKLIGISAGWYPGKQYVYFEVPCKKGPDYEVPAVKNVDISEDYYDFLQEETEPETVKFSTPICFDDAFTDVMRPMFLNGAELFVNITDDSWSLTKSSEIQHFAIAAYKAIEYRTTLIRSANAGYSVVVTPNGKVICDQPLFEESSTTCDVPIYERKMTTYARFGNWLTYTIAILFIAYCIYMFFTFKKSDFIESERNKKITLGKKSKKNSKK